MRQDILIDFLGVTDILASVACDCDPTTVDVQQCFPNNPATPISQLVICPDTAGYDGNEKKKFKLIFFFYCCCCCCLLMFSFWQHYLLVTSPTPIQVAKVLAQISSYLKYLCKTTNKKPCQNCQQILQHLPPQVRKKIFFFL